MFKSRVDNYQVFNHVFDFVQTYDHDLLEQLILKFHMCNCKNFVNLVFYPQSSIAFNLKSELRDFLIKSVIENYLEDETKMQSLQAYLQRNFEIYFNKQEKYFYKFVVITNKENK